MVFGAQAEEARMVEALERAEDRGAPREGPAEAHQALGERPEVGRREIAGDVARVDEDLVVLQVLAGLRDVLQELERIVEVRPAIGLRAAQPLKGWTRSAASGGTPRRRRGASWPTGVRRAP